MVIHDGVEYDEKKEIIEPGENCDVYAQEYYIDGELKRRDVEVKVKPFILGVITDG